MSFDSMLRRTVPLLLLATLAACGAEPGERSATILVEAGSYSVAGDSAPSRASSPLRLPAEPRLERVTLDDERRPAMVLPADGVWRWRVRVPEGGRLQVGLGALDGGPVEATVALVRGDDREIVEVIRPAAPVPGAGGQGNGDTADGAGAGWMDAGVDLSDHAGQEVTLELALQAGAGGDVAWAPVAITGTRPAAGRGGDSRRPNILVIVVDTLRADHLATYGYDRDTAPQIDRLLVAPGAVAENAYSQAPWTLPSVVSYMTSRYPGELLHGDPATFGIPDRVPSLAEVFSGLGYRTGGFFANPTLHASNGFDRGFDTFYTPSSMTAIQAHADEINRRALPWMNAHRDQPFFLYVHYIDPHDPYWNPDLVKGRSPYFDDPGGISGKYLHGVYTGRLEVDDIDRQVRHFTALYDTEIRFVDRAIGELLAEIPPEVLAETVVLLTADHGEELYDHGGWKHGHTLYQDQIHVPFIARWDGRIPAGTRLPGTVRLVDLAPTLVAAAGGEAPATWQGTDLLPALTGRENLPRLAAFSQHLTAGPMRTAAVFEGRKLILFNRREPFQATDGLQQHIYDLDMARLARLELYDLASDPREDRNLFQVTGEADGEQASAQPAGALDAVIQNHLHRTLRGVRAFGDALPAGARLTGELRFAEPPEGALPLFLGPEDRLTTDGATVRFEIVGGPVTKGFLLPGEPRALEAAELWLDGEPLPAGRLHFGPGTPYTGRTVDATAYDTEAFPQAGDRPGLRLWRFGGERPDAAEVDPETRRSLEALGYIQ